MRRALLVGINKYCEKENEDECNVGNLNGCVGDALRMYNVLSSHEDGSQNFECLLIATESDRPDDQEAIIDIESVNPESVNIVSKIPKMTTDLIMKYLYELFTNKADVVLFYFAGHGIVNDLGGYLVTPDYKPYNPGVSMPDLLTLANNAVADEVIIIIDCCYSGKMGEIPIFGNENVILREGVSILTGTASSQEAVEEDGSGLFTSVVVESLSGVAKDFLGQITVANVYAHVEQVFGAWKQRPLYKSNVRKMVTLRRGLPPVPFESLRKITEYFPGPKSSIKLDPSYEHSEPDYIPENVATFNNLKVLRNAGLIETEEKLDLYFCATGSKRVWLSNKGRYYWRLAKMQKFGIDISI